MTQSLPTRLRETAMRIQREESVHLGNLRKLLVEAANALEDKGGQLVEPDPRGGPLDAVGLEQPSGRGKLSVRSRLTPVRRRAGDEA